MVSQGLWGALVQFWSIEDKPRLDRRNTYFEDNFNVSNTDALRFGLFAIVVCMIVFGSWCFVGVWL